MQSEISAGQFIESATFSGNIYGTSKAAVQAVSDEGKVICGRFKGYFDVNLSVSGVRAGHRRAGR